MNEQEDDDGGIFLYTGGRAPHDIVIACIDQTISNIPDSAFRGCKALEYVTLHDGVMTIGKGAFDGCQSLELVIMSANSIHTSCTINKVLSIDSTSKTADIQNWLQSVRPKIGHHEREREKLNNAARISCDSVDNTMNEGNDAGIEVDIHGSIIPAKLEERDTFDKQESSNYTPFAKRLPISSCSKLKSDDTSASLSGYQYSEPADNVDERDIDDPLCVTTYVEDMYEYFRSKEAVTSVRPVYMNNQPFINERCRSIVVDWLVEGHMKFKLDLETLYLTINIIDRYLAKAEVTRPKFQLIGVTALLIASKYEDIYPPELKDLVYICDKAYTENDILEMEGIILDTLEYRITVPSAYAFLMRYLKAAHADKKMVQISCYILDGTLQSYNMLHYLPSQLAAASILIARKVVGRNSWSPTLLKYTNYREEDIKPIARAVLAAKNSTIRRDDGSELQLQAVNKKYAKTTYGCVSNLTLPTDL